MTGGGGGTAAETKGLADLGLAAQGGREARLTGLTADSRELTVELPTKAPEAGDAP